MPRCNSCKKFTSLDEAEPEVQCLDVDDDGAISAEVRIVNTCAECNEELTEYTFSVDTSVDVPESTGGHMHELEIDEGDCERTTPDHTPPRKDGKPVLSRYRKRWYGFALSATVRCEGCGWEEMVTLADDVQASSMEHLS